MSLEERIVLVKEVNGHGGKSSEEVQNLFKKKFEEKCLPGRHCVIALIKEFEKTESVQDGPCSGRLSIITEEILQDITNKLDRIPQKSLRHLSQETGISLTST